VSDSFQVHASVINVPFVTIYIALLTTLLNKSYYIIHKLNAVIPTVYELSHSIYIYRVNDVRQTEIDAAEPLVPETSAVDLR